MNPEPIINNPHALYCNGELIGVILNPDPVCGGAGGILEALNDTEPDSVYDMVTIPINNHFYEWGMMRSALQALKVQSEIVPSERDDEEDDN